MVERYADEKFQEWRNLPAPKSANILSAFILRVRASRCLTSPQKPRCNQHANWQKHNVMCTENARTRIF